MATSDAFHGVIKQPVTTLINPAIMFTHTGMALVYTLPIHRFTFIMLALEFNWSYTRKANILNPSHCACFISAALQPCRAQHATLFWMHWTYKQLYRMMKALIRKCLCLSLCTLCCSQWKLREALKCHPVLSSRAFYLIHDSKLRGAGESWGLQWGGGREENKNIGLKNVPWQTRAFVSLDIWPLLFENSANSCARANQKCMAYWQYIHLFIE